MHSRVEYVLVKEVDGKDIILSKNLRTAKKAQCYARRWKDKGYHAAIKGKTFLRRLSNT
jgi:hypothetical protein